MCRHIYTNVQGQDRLLNLVPSLRPMGPYGRVPARFMSVEGESHGGTGTRVCHS
jgi:hypothetical protein